MENRRQIDPGKKQTSGTASRRSIKKVNSEPDKSSPKMTPAIAAVIAAIAVIVICTPLIILSFGKTEEVSDDKIITAAELGFTAVTPSPSELVIPDSALSGPETSSGSSDYLYEKGMTNPQIKEIQQRLMSLGYMAEAEPTELFGPATAEAVQLFQAKHGLNTSGKIDRKTYDILFSDSAVFYTALVGSSGSDVATIQSLLKKLGYFSGAATGYFGTETEAAVKSFQKNNGLTADGKVGINTLKVLKSADAVKYTAPTPSPSSSAPEPSQQETA